MVRMGSAEKLISVKGLGALQIHCFPEFGLRNVAAFVDICLAALFGGAKTLWQSGNPKEFIVV